MARGAELYEQQLGVPDAPRATIAVNNPTVPDAGGMFAALSSAAGEVQRVAQQQQRADQEAQLAGLTADHLTKLRALEEEGTQSTDYVNAPQQFREARDKLTGETLSGVGDPRAREALRLRLTTSGLSAEGKVNAAALGRRQDATVGGLNVETDDLLTRATTAGSPYEQKAMRDGAFASIDRAVAAGAIGEAEAVRRKRLFDRDVSAANAARLMKSNPSAVLQALDDPTSFPGLSAGERISLGHQALGVYDTQEGLRAGELAKRDPALAAARYGVITTRAHADDFYRRIIIPHESGGNPNAIGKDGESGLGQIMPDTARAQARKLGLANVAALDDDGIREALRNPELNIKLGSAEWSDLLKRYNGNVWAAAAAYNKGAGRADKWDAVARDKFGDHYSASQLAGVVDSDVGRNYVLKVAQRMGVDTNAPPLSFRGSYGGAAIVQQQLGQEANEQKRLLNAAIRIGAPERDAISDALKAGYTVDPERLERAKAPLIAGASRGDVEMTMQLRQLEEREALKPIIEEAFKHPPEEVAAAVAEMDARAAKGELDGVGQRQLEVLRGVSSEMEKTRKSNPVGLAERQLGPASVTHVGVPKNGVNDVAFIDQLARRDVVARQAQATYGGELKFFKPEERDAVKPWYEGLQPAEQAAVLGTLAQALSGPSREAAMRELTDGKPLTMFAGGLFAQDKEIATSILMGAKNLDTYVPSSGAAKQAYQAAKLERLPPAMFTTSTRLETEGTLAAMNAAIDARYAYLSAQANDGSKALNTTRLQRATDDVTGGVLYHNGAPLIAPARGMKQEQLDGVLLGLTDADLASAGTATGKAITADYLRYSAKLKPLTAGVYLVQTNQDDDAPRFAVSMRGGLFKLDLRNRQPAVNTRGAIGRKRWGRRGGLSYTSDVADE